MLYIAPPITRNGRGYISCEGGGASRDAPPGLAPQASHHKLDSSWISHQFRISPKPDSSQTEGTQPGIMPPVQAG